MATATAAQANRPLSVTINGVPEDALLINGFTGNEAMSNLFSFRVDVELAPNATVDFEQILGQYVTIKIALQKDQSRYFNGLCVRVSQGDPSEATRYSLHVVPQLWLLTRKSNRRVFQKKTVIDVLKEVFTGLQVSWKTQGEFDSHNLIVQYDESDFAFASRLMEEEGIYYYFEHANGSHKLVVANTPDGHQDTDPANAVYDVARDRSGDSCRVFNWEKSQEVRSTKFVIRDHSFELTGKDLEAPKQILDSAVSGTVTHKLKVSSVGELELYEYPGGYAQRFDSVESGGASVLQKNFQSNGVIAQRRIDQAAMGALESSGSSDAQSFSPGYQFTLKEHPHADGKYVLTSVHHSASLGAAFRSGDDTAVEYSNSFSCIPVSIPFRPSRVTPRPVIHGLQSAVVTGPPGEEIYVDKYGRIRIQFHWDRQGQTNETSTCWVRVSQPSSGQQWGSFFWPRIGHEVLVAFMEGDPDQPVVVGSVYNDANMPPYTLPDNRTRSGIKTRSSLNGTGENFNELRFEDKKGEEEIYLHAEKNLNAVIENNETRKIGFEKKDKGDQTVEIFNNQTLKVGNAQADDGSQSVEIWKNRDVKIKTGNDTLLIEQGNMSVTLSMGNQDTALKMGNQSTTLDMGNLDTTLKMGNQTTKLDLGASSTEAMQSIELKVGQSSIKLDQTGVTIKGMMVKVEGTVQTSVKGLMTQLNGDAMLTVKGGLTMIN